MKTAIWAFGSGIKEQHEGSAWLGTRRSDAAAENREHGLVAGSNGGDPSWASFSFFFLF
jgi:hypothetical protein